MQQNIRKFLKNDPNATTGTLDADARLTGQLGPNVAWETEAPVGDADAVGVAAEIAQHLLGASEGRFAVHVPAFVLKGGAEPSEALRVNRPLLVGQPKLV